MDHTLSYTEEARIAVEHGDSPAAQIMIRKSVRAAQGLPVRNYADADEAREIREAGDG
ncbi:hypothetical protein [Streptomyces tateyamensis]|uniref:hypothetical protein n=1 Tax=Streptomyces tateyamensis TaxID=565073 RepID=UPI0015E8B082|nr:hypothetical protein [Streptomyces tateyamensis]